MIKTSIEGLKLSENKVAGDERGVLYELIPGGTNNESVKGGIGNIYAAVAQEKGVPRAGHFHNTNVENIFTLTGSALWFLKDFREKSPTKGESFLIILGSEHVKIEDLPQYTLKDKKLIHLHIPTGVYHTFWPLTDNPVMVVSVASHPHNPEDHFSPPVEEDKKLQKVVEKLNLRFPKKR